MLEALTKQQGHVEERKAEYRKISKEWHQFLGFLPALLPARKRPLGDITNHADRVAKRAKCDMTDKPGGRYRPGEADGGDIWDF